MHIIIILIKSVFNKNQDYCYYKVLLEKCSYKWYKNADRNYDRIDVSEGINVNKTSASKVIIICHYWYILDKGFEFVIFLELLSWCVNDVYLP